MKKTIFFSILLIVTFALGKTQQTFLLSHSHHNPIVLNPARTGDHGLFKSHVHYRKQWTKIYGSPETFLFTLDGNIPLKRIGLGLVAFSDNLNILNKSGLYGTYRYGFDFSQHHYLAFGASIGYASSKIYFDKIKAQDKSELAIYDNINKSSGMDANLGVSYKFKNWNVDVAANQLLGSKLKFADNKNTQELNYQSIQHYYAGVSYSHNIPNTSLALKPMLAARTAKGLPVQLEGGMEAMWNKKISLTLLYRQNYGISAGISVELYDQIKLAYAYDISMNKISKQMGNTNEIMIAYTIGDNKKTPRSVRQSKDFISVSEQNQKQYQEIEELQEKNENLKTNLDNTKEELENQKEEIKRLKEIFERDLEKLAQVKTKYEVRYEDINEKQENTKDYYIIVGAYFKLQDAIFFQKILKRELNTDTRIFEREDGKYIFVYTKKSKDKKEIKKEMRKLNRSGIKEYISGNVWIYGNNN